MVPGRSDREQVLEIVGHEALVWSQDETTFVLVADQGHEALVWSQDETTFVLVADQGPVEFGLVTDYVR